MDFHRRQELFLYATLGIVCAMAGTVWPRVFYGTRDMVFRRLRVPRWTKPAVGAAALGVIGMVFPEALGMGYGYIQEAIEGQRTIGFLLTFAAVKIVATSLTISSGGSGGVFGPSLVIGGAFGAAFGMTAQEWLPSFAPEPAACIMVGMCGFFAGVAKAPIASVIMVVEMTGSYGLLVPSLLVSAIAYLTLPIGIRLYENQVPNRLDSPAHTGSYAVDVLRLAKVRSVWAPPARPVRSVGRETPLRDILSAAADVDQSVFPVVDAEGRCVGEVSLEDVRRAVVRGDEAGGRADVAGDLVRKGRTPLELDDDLATAARLLGEPERASVPVVRSREDPTLLGLFGRRDLIVAYGPLVERARGGNPTT
jgi:CIC family chloride channel protein